MDHPIGRVPYPPDLHITLTVWTAQGVTPGAPLIALAVGQRGHDLDRALDDVLHLGQGLVNHVLDCGKRPSGLHAVIPDPLKTFRKDMLHHTSDKRVDRHRFPLHPLTLVGPIMIRHLVAIVVIDAPEGDRWAHDILGQVGRQALIA
jgi:hypothetical protein